MRVTRVFLFAMIVWLFICNSALASNWSIEGKSGYWHSFEGKFFGVNGLVSDIFELEGELRYAYQLEFLKSNLTLSSTVGFAQAKVAIEADPEDSPPWAGRVKLGRLSSVPVMTWAGYELLLDKFSPYIRIGTGYSFNRFSNESRIADVDVNDNWLFGARGGIRYLISKRGFIGMDFKYVWGHAKIGANNNLGFNQCDS